MKYSMKAIMTRAWEIRRQHADNLFSICLEMAWEEARKPSYLEGEELYDRLVDMGARRWAKGGNDRIYLNQVAEEMVGLELDYYKSGNIRAASINGDRISNSEGSRIAYALSSFYIDAKTGSIWYTASSIARQYLPIIREKLHSIPA